MNDVKLSKFLSLVLRHQPERIGLALDDGGWVSIETLLRACAAQGVPLTRGDVDRVVATSEKKRFALNENGTRIRANQGHSVTVNLGLEPKAPPGFLFHGTSLRFIESIRAEGLRRQARHHVHLSRDKVTALAVGQRHGNPVVLIVSAEEMSRQGHLFFLSDNGVWLTEHVPLRFIAFPTDRSA